MAVMGIAHMRMDMFQLPVAVLMGMPKGAISRVPRQILRGVFVLVVGVDAAGIVSVAMGMQERFMTVEMAVLLTQQQSHTGGHQSRSEKQVC